MDRNEQARKKRKDTNNKAVQNERDEKMVKAVSEIEKALPVLMELLKYKEQDYVILQKVQKIILSKPLKIQADFVYEEDKGYRALMQERQQVINHLLDIEKQNEITKLKDTIQEHKETLVSYKAQLNFMEGD